MLLWLLQQGLHWVPTAALLAGCCNGDSATLKALCPVLLPLLQKLLAHAPLAVEAPKLTDPHTKVNALVQVSRQPAALRSGAVRYGGHGRQMQQRCGDVSLYGVAFSPLTCCAPGLRCLACPPCPQSHLSRSPLNPDMAADQRDVVGGATRLLQAMVDVISSSGWLNPALAGGLGLAV